MQLIFQSKLITSIFLLCLLFSSCKKDEKINNTPEPIPTPTVTYGNVKLQFNNVVDAQALVLGTTYLNPSNESYSVSKFNYYISNVTLTKSDNSIVEVKDVYRIVQQNNDTSKQITLRNIPVGNYISIKVMLGVDSSSNCSGAHSGGLDFDYAWDMFWGWNQGYIFLKLEGAAPSSTVTNNIIEYHIGGYGGVYKTQKNFNLNFGSTQAIVTQTSAPLVSLNVNVNELFKNPQMISFTNKPLQTSTGVGAKMIADNYGDMISLDKIVN